MAKRIAVPANSVAVILDLILARELQSLVQARRRKLGVRMSRLTLPETVNMSDGEEAVAKAVAQQERWQEAKIERDVLNDFLLALVDAEVDHA